MPGATPRGYPYPLGTEPADGSADMEALARAVDGDLTAALAAQSASAGGTLSFSKTSGFTAATNMLLPYVGVVPGSDNRLADVATGSGTKVTLRRTGVYVLTFNSTIAWSGDSMDFSAAAVHVNGTADTGWDVFGWMNSVTGPFSRAMAGPLAGGALGRVTFLSPAPIGGTVTAFNCKVGIAYLGT